MNNDLDICPYSYTTPTELGSKIEKIMANVFYSTFLNVFILSTFGKSSKTE